jgi:hypothetical protein
MYNACVFFTEPGQHLAARYIIYTIRARNGGVFYRAVHTFSFRCQRNYRYTSVPSTQRSGEREKKDLDNIRDDDNVCFVLFVTCYIYMYVCKKRT